MRGAGRTTLRLASSSLGTSAASDMWRPWKARLPLAVGVLTADSFAGGPQTRAYISTSTISYTPHKAVRNREGIGTLIKCYSRRRQMPTPFSRPRRGIHQF
eukprot:scaffold80773_cov68-Phaeocystis_antarctica.AAC.2